MGYRKFFYGDRVAVKTEQLHNHTGHNAIITKTFTNHLSKTNNTRVKYKLDCECGKNLSLQADKIELISTPHDDTSDWDVHTARLKYFLQQVKGSHVSTKHGLEKKVSQRFSKLSDREKTILEYRFSIGPDKTYMNLRELGEMFGISHQRVLVIQNKAMEKLR